MMLLTLIVILVMVIIMNKNYSNKNNLLFILYWLLLFRQTRGENWSKEFEGDARSILSKLHHYHTQSNVAQHEVVTLTT